MWEETTPLPFPQDSWFLPYFAKRYLCLGIFGACLFIQGKGVSKRAQTQINPLPPALRETHSQVMCCFPEINTSGPLHKSGCPHLITSIHITLKLKRSLKTTGSATLFYVWKSGNPVVSRTWPRSTRQTRDWGNDNAGGIFRFEATLEGSVTLPSLFMAFRMTHSVLVSNWFSGAWGETKLLSQVREGISWEHSTPVNNVMWCISFKCTVTLHFYF